MCCSEIECKLDDEPNWCWGQPGKLLVGDEPICFDYNFIRMCYNIGQPNEVLCWQLSEDADIDIVDIENHIKELLARAPELVRELP